VNRGLTLAEALAGVQPAKLTKAEWEAMHQAAQQLEAACGHRWSPWETHATGRVRWCARCQMTQAEPKTEPIPCGGPQKPRGVDSVPDASTALS